MTDAEAQLRAELEVAQSRVMELQLRLMELEAKLTELSARTAAPKRRHWRVLPYW